MKRSTIIVLLIAIALGAYVYFYEMKHGTARDDAEVSKPAFTFKSEDVVRLNVTFKGQSVVAEKSDKGWAITQPVRTEADQSAIDSLVSSVTTANVERSLAMTENLRRGSGLAAPEATVEIKLKDGSTHNLVLGRKDPTEANVYALIDQGKDISLLPTSLSTSAGKSLNDLRSKEILKLLESDVTGVELTNSSLTLVAEKSGDKWLIKKPAAEKDREANAGKFLTALSTQATEVIDTPDDKVRTAAAKAGAEVTYKTKDGKAVKINVSAEDGESVYVKVDGRPEIFKAGKSLLESMTFKIADVVVKPESPATKGEDFPEKQEDKK